MNTQIRVFALVVACIVSGPAVALSVFKTTLCTCDQASEWAWHAQQSAFNELPVLTEGRQDIYLGNPFTLEVQVYRVERIQTGADVGFGDGFWTTEVAPILGDPEIAAAIEKGMQVVRSFDASLNEVISLPNPPNIPGLQEPPDIGSAVDLVGEGPSSASLNRRALANWTQQLLMNRFADSLAQATEGRADQTFLETLGTVVQIVLDFLNQQRAVWVEFADGSRVLVLVTDIIAEITTEGLLDGAIPTVQVDPETAQGPGLNGVPQFAEEFAGFGFSGDAGTLFALSNLALRLGVSIEFGPGGGGTCSGGTMECEINDDGVLHCRVTLSKEELRACAEGG